MTTYAERELKPHGWSRHESDTTKTGRNDKEVRLRRGHLILLFECVCPAYPDIVALGCPLHHSGVGDSSPVIEAKRIT